MCPPPPAADRSPPILIYYKNQREIPVWGKIREPIKRVSQRQTDRERQLVFSYVKSVQYLCTAGCVDHPEGKTSLISQVDEPAKGDSVIQIGFTHHVPGATCRKKPRDIW
jgi:hypothetical protein